MPIFSKENSGSILICCGILAVGDNVLSVGRLNPICLVSKVNILPMLVLFVSMIAPEPFFEDIEVIPGRVLYPFPPDSIANPSIEPNALFEFVVY